MFYADPYLAERMMELNVAEARSRPPAGKLHLPRRAARRLAIALVALGGKLVLLGLPPYPDRDTRRAAA